MIFSRTSLLYLLISSTATTSAVQAVHHALTHSTRLPMSLSAVLADMEAEGLETVTPCLLVFDSSASDKIIADLIDCDVEECDDVQSGAIGSAKGLAIALPTSPYEAMATVEACAGTVLYVMQDDVSASLNVSLLAPAVEKVINSNKLGSNVDGKPPLIVIVNGEVTNEVKRSFLNKAHDMLTDLVQPMSASRRIRNIEDAFAVNFISSSNVGDISTLLDSVSCEPSDASSTVASTVAQIGVPTDNPSMLSSLDLEAYATLASACSSAFHTAVDALVEEAGSGLLIPNFGLRVDTAINVASEEFEKAAESDSMKNSFIGKRMKKDLLDEVLIELEGCFEEQLVQLRSACFEKFRQSLSTLRISPNLPKDMDQKVSESVTDFATAAKKLKPSKASWNSSGAQSDYRSMLKEFCTDRLKAARLSGAFKDAPRKAVSVGLHWLIPKPFGTDSQQTPSSGRFDPSNIVYTPPSKRVDIGASEIMEGTGSWKSQITPSTAGSAMIYKSEDPQAGE